MEKFPWKGGTGADSDASAKIGCIITSVNAYNTGDLLIRFTKMDDTTVAPKDVDSAIKLKSVTFINEPTADSWTYTLPTVYNARGTFKTVTNVWDERNLLYQCFPKTHL